MTVYMTHADWNEVVKIAVAQEREACAKIAEEWARHMVWVDGKPKKLLDYTDAADAIRRR